MKWEDMAVVGRIARPHGIRGQVILNAETDFPDERFQPGSELFVVYTDERDTLKPGYPDLKNRAFVVKVNRLLRF